MAVALRELTICWSFTKGDLSATVIPATIFATAAWSYSGRPLPDLVGIVARCLVYFWLYIYTFNLSNQVTGVVEDRLNKPDRPLISGLVTVRDTWWRLAVVSVGFVVVGFTFGVVEWAVLWILAWIVHDHLGGAANWWGKNSAMVVGTIAQLAAAWQIVTPVVDTTWKWIMAIAVPLAFLVSLQDLRDIEGDALNNRRTAVVVFGEIRLRFLLCGLFAVYPVGLYFLLYHNAPIAAIMIAAIATVLCWIISLRVIRHRGSASDNLTYALYTYWYCFTLASAVPALAI